MTRLVGPRLTLREFIAADVAHVHVFASDPRVTRYTTWGPNTAEQTRSFVIKTLGQQDEPDRRTYTLAITLTGSGLVIGTCELGIDSPADRRASVGFVLHADHWGRGYATEALGMLLGLGFSGLGLHRVAATCDPRNEASARVLEKSGMVLEGHLHDYFLVDGTWRDALLYAAVSKDAAGRDEPRARDGVLDLSLGGQRQSETVRLHDPGARPPEPRRRPAPGSPRS